MNLDGIVAFILAREDIRIRKERGDPWPWSDDKILNAFRFCNVRRNDDAQTRLIHSNWLKPHADDPDLWFAMTVARLVNWWPSLADVGYPVPWDTGRFQRAMAKRKAAGQKVFTGAYMVRADAVLTGSKADYLALYVLDPLWQAREKVRPRSGDTLQKFHSRLMEYRDMGSFMAAQIVADVKYANPSHLARASDWMDWAAAGPGSLRGLNRVAERPKDHPYRKWGWQAEFAPFLKALRAKLAAAGFSPPLTGQDAQNCLCEWDKYERVRLGEGFPRAIYRPTL